MNMNEKAAAVEAIVFASGSPVELNRLKSVLELKDSETEKIVENLKNKFNNDESGISLLELDGALQFSINTVFIKEVRTVLELNKNTPLSNAAMEVLSLVAYNEPVTRAYIEQVRGVDCGGVISTLMQKALIEERGRLELPGRPLVYGTTKNFLRCFGIKDISELPPLPENTDASNNNEGAES